MRTISMPFYIIMKRHIRKISFKQQGLLVSRYGVVMGKIWRRKRKQIRNQRKKSTYHMSGREIPHIRLKCHFFYYTRRIPRSAGAKAWKVDLSLCVKLRYLSFKTVKKYWEWAEEVFCSKKIFTVGYSRKRKTVENFCFQKLLGIILAAILSPHMGNLSENEGVA